MFDPFSRRAPSGALSDQAQGLRSLFASRQALWMPVVSNPFVKGSGAVMEHVVAACENLGVRVLVVDAAEDSPPASPLTALDLHEGMDLLSERIAYLPARGLIRRHVGEDGTAQGLLDALRQAAPGAEVTLLHAPASELARLCVGHLLRPVILTSDDVEAIKHAYASAKYLQQRLHWSTFDLGVVSQAAPSRLASLVDHFSACADRFFDAVLSHWFVVNPAAPSETPVDERLQDMMSERLSRHRQGVNPGGVVQGTVPPVEARARLGSSVI